MPAPDTQTVHAPSTSRLAIVSLVLAVIPCCPVTSMLGAFLGVMALRRIDRSGGRLGGRRIAGVAVAAGVGLSLLSLVAWARFGSWRDGKNQEAMVARVTAVIDAASNDDPGEVRSNWTLRDGVKPPDDTAVAQFGGAVVSRYGALESVRVSSSRVTGTMFKPSFDVAVFFRFDSGERTGSARFDLIPVPGALSPAFRLRNLVIDDADGTLTLQSREPAGEVAAPSTPP